MKLFKYISFSLLLFNFMSVFAQTDAVPKSRKNFPLRELTIEPGIGLNPMPNSDLVLSNVFAYAIFNVKAYGAKGDGFTDDTRSIQDAVDAALAIHLAVHTKRYPYMQLRTEQENGACLIWASRPAWALSPPTVR